MMSMNMLNVKAKSFVPSKETLKKLEKLENENRLKKEQIKIEEIFFDKKETEWWEANKTWLSMD